MQVSKKLPETSTFISNVNISNTLILLKHILIFIKIK